LKENVLWILVYGSECENRGHEVREQYRKSKKINLARNDNDQREGKPRQAKTVQKRAEEVEIAKRNNN
jgi:hypothetical protein